MTTQSLLETSLSRATRDGALPSVAGNSPREKLINARDGAREALRKYVPNFVFDTEKARDVTSQVGGWVQRNSVELEEAMEDPGTSVPRALCISMGSAEQVQQWILAIYTVGAAGMGPWDSGQLDRLAVDPNSDISPLWVGSDARDRLNLFRMILGMERDGELERIFRPQAGGRLQDPCGGASGFGLATAVIVAIVVSVTVFAAVVVYLYLDSQRVERNNIVLKEICLNAQRACHAGNEAACVESLKCIEALRDISKGGAKKGPFAELGKLALAVGAGYAFIVYGMPWILGKASDIGQKNEAGR